jgi:RimJ/RimL family protein N-acetyltransferase
MKIKPHTLEHPYMIQAEKVRLRFLHEDDLKKCLCWLQDPEVNKFLSQDFNDLTETDERKWLREIKSSGKEHVFAIEDKLKKKYIGNCGLHKIDRDKKNATLGIVIGEKQYWGKGYGTDSIHAIIGYAKNELGLRYLQLNVYEYNHRAIKVYENCGFKRKTVLKKNHYYNNKYWDTFVMELILHNEKI